MKVRSVSLMNIMIIYSSLLVIRHSKTLFLSAESSMTNLVIIPLQSAHNTRLHQQPPVGERISLDRWLQWKQHPATESA